MQTYNGSCHCGAVRYEVEMEELKKAVVCNCSHCHKIGAVLAFAPESAFTLLAGEENLTEYLFNKKHIAHLFCKTCGVESFARGKDKDGADTVAINARCLDGVDIDTLELQKFNGKDI